MNTDVAWWWHHTHMLSYWKCFHALRCHLLSSVCSHGWARHVKFHPADIRLWSSSAAHGYALCSCAPLGSVITVLLQRREKPQVHIEQLMVYCTVQYFIQIHYISTKYMTWQDPGFVVMFNCRVMTGSVFLCLGGCFRFYQNSWSLPQDCVCVQRGE